MLTKSDYIEWITQYPPLAVFNLASSGTPSLSPEESAFIPKITVKEPRQAMRDLIAHVHGVSVDEVAACNGASQAMWLAYAALIRPGDEVLVETPTYGPFVDTAVCVGAKVARFARKRSENFALDPDMVCRALSRRTRVVALTNLHNPSGVRVDESTIRPIAERLRMQNGFVLVDEVYAPFDRSADSLGIACRTSRHVASNIVVVSSLGKAFGLGEHRVGWMIGPPDVVERANAALRASTGNLPVCWASFAIGALGQLPALGGRAERLMCGKRERVDAWIAQRPRLNWSRPADGLFGLVTVSGARDLRAKIEAGIIRCGVIVVPGSFFEIPDAFRIAWSLPEACLDEALARLDSVLFEKN